jgi:glycosyltransferase involved in cell wall biosynthesis
MAPPTLDLSAAIVCRNNAATIGRTLDSLTGRGEYAGGLVVGEIVAVDSGSTDGTIERIEAAASAGTSVRVIRSEWLGHVKTKQKALEACSKAWVLCIDSDESVELDLAAAITRALTPPVSPSVDAFSVNRKVFYRGRPLNHAWQPERRVRLVRSGRAAWKGLDPHDVLEPAIGATVLGLSGTLRHDSVATFAEFLAKQATHARTMAISLHAAGKRSSYTKLALSPVLAGLKQLVLKRAFMDGYAGWLAAASSAAGTLMKHAALIELSNGARGGARESGPGGVDGVSGGKRKGAP